MVLASGFLLDAETVGRIQREWIRRLGCKVYEF
jgi:hypothetical protein